MNLLDRSAVEFAILDYPALHAPWLREQLHMLNPDTQPVPWTRACWALMIIEDETDYPWLKEHLPECMQRADAQGLHLEWATLRFIQETEASDEAANSDLDVKIQTLVAASKQRSDPDAVAFVAASYATTLLTLRDLDRALAFVVEAVQLVNSQQSQSLLVYQRSKVAFGMILSYQEKHKESSQVDDSIIEHYQKIGLRKKLAEALYNRGISHIQQEPPDYDAARRDLSLAVQKAEQVQDEVVGGASNYGLGLIARRTGQLQQAERLFQEAIGIFHKIKDEHWVFVCKLQLAEILVEKKKYEAASLALDEVEKLAKDEGRERKNQIVQLRYTVHKGLKDWKRALALLEIHEKEAIELARSREKDEYNRSAVALGLQLEKQKTDSLRQENLLQAQKLREAERFRIFVILLSLLSLSTLGLLLFAIRQIKRIHASRQQIQIILDNIDEGLLTVDHRLTVGRDYSKHLNEMIQPQEPIAGQDFVNAIFQASAMSNEQKSIVREVLQASFGEESIAWDMNAANLPMEIPMRVRGEEIYVMRWIPIFNRSGRMDRLLVSMTDVTKSRELEQALSHHEKHLRSLPDTLREIVQIQPERIDLLLQRTEEVLQGLEFGSDQVDTLRQLHTQKGVARTLGLRGISQHLHDLESGLAASSWSKSLLATRETLHEYRTYREIVHRGPARLAGKLWLPAAVEPQLDTWLGQMVEAHLPVHAFRIDDGILNWRPDDFALVQELCLHAINNSLDHGFLFPQKKGRAVEHPVFDLSARQHEGWITVELRDNGIGLDLEKLQALAAAKNFVPSDTETLTDFLFMDGVSTADSLSLTSGRGVGLAAVRARVLLRGGAVGIRNREDASGTVIWLRMPG